MKSMRQYLLFSKTSRGRGPVSLALGWLVLALQATPMPVPVNAGRCIAPNRYSAT